MGGRYMNNMDLETLRKMADENLTHSIRHRILHSKNGELQETDSYMIYTLGVDNEDGHINGVLFKNINSYEDGIKRAEDFFKPMNRDYIIWVRDHVDRHLEKILLSKGLEPKRIPGSSGMIIRHRINSISTPEGFQLKEVANSKEVEDFSIVTQNAFDKPNIVRKEMFSSDNILISSSTVAFIIYEKDKPMAAASIMLSGSMAGIYWVGTVEEGRGKGLGSYITQIVTNAAFDKGANTVILQASIAGERIYKKLGYETITHYRWYPINF